MSGRDELAKALSEHEYIAFEDDRNTWECECLTVMSHDPSKPGHMEHLADAILAAGYRKPRTVSTAAELDAAIIRAFENGENLVLLAKGGWRPYILWEDDRGDLHVTSTPMEDDAERLTLSDIALPATVLFEGEK